jgi:Flp pilus assembly protein TadB
MNDKAYWPKALIFMAACIFIVVIDILPIWVLVAVLIIVSAFVLRWFLKGPVRR